MSEKLITEIWLNEGDGPVKASAEVTFPTEFGELTISRIKVIHQPDKLPWVCYPDISYKDEATQVWKHIPIIKPGAALNKRITESILLMYRETISASK